MSRGREIATRMCWAATAAVAVRGAGGVRNVAASLGWFHRYLLQEPDPAGGDGSLQVVVILPMLREQRVIADTLTYFADLASRSLVAMCLAVVTTARERTELAPVGKRSWATATNDLAADLVGALRRSGVQAEHYDYPDPDGAMAHQVNYAAEREIRRLAAAGVPPQRVWLAVYNADSRPHPATFAALTCLVARRGAQGDAPRLVQQSAVFTANLTELASRPLGGVLVGAALLQSRWTLAREVPRLRRQANQARRSTRTSRLWPRLAHCVGHGLFVRADEFTTRGGLPTSTMNEDLAFGYLACAAGTPIDALPVLECAEAPDTVGGLIRQARQWFWSYPEYPRFARQAHEAGWGSRWSRRLLTAHGLLRGGLWLAQSPAVAATLALPALDRRPRAVASTGAALAAYVGVPLVLINHHPLTCPGLGRDATAVAGGLAACLIASVGPWWCLANAADRAIRGTVYRHDKTER